MSIQPTLTPEQQAQLCDECAPGGTTRYCIPGGTCHCNHKSCPAYDPARVLIRGLPNVTALPTDGPVDEPQGGTRQPRNNRGTTKYARRKAT